MSAYAPIVGERVRVTDSPTDALPNGTEGTVIATFYDMMPGALFFKAEGLDRPLGIFGQGWALTADEVEKIEEAA